MWAHTCTQNHPKPPQDILQQISPVLYIQGSAPVLYAPNLRGAGSWTLWSSWNFLCLHMHCDVYFPQLSTQMREKNISLWFRHLLNSSKREGSHTVLNQVFTFPARCTLVGHWRNVLKSCDFKQLVHDKTPNKGPSGSLFLCLIILSKWENIHKETVVGKEKGNSE